MTKQERQQVNGLKDTLKKEPHETLLKIAFLGTQSTGKTQKAKVLSKKENLMLVTGTARSCPLPINKNATRETQLYIYATQLQKEIDQLHVAEAQGLDGIVCDRTLLDPLVYALDRGYSTLVEMLLPFTRVWMNTYTKLYWCRPAKGTVPQRDGIRNPDPMWQTRIDRRFEAFITDIFRLNVEIINTKEEENEG